MSILPVSFDTPLAFDFWSEKSIYNMDRTAISIVMDDHEGQDHEDPKEEKYEWIWTCCQWPSGQDSHYNYMQSNHERGSYGQDNKEQDYYNQVSYYHGSNEQDSHTNYEKSNSEHKHKVALNIGHVSRSPLPRPKVSYKDYNHCGEQPHQPLKYDNRQGYEYPRCGHQGDGQ